MVDYLETRINHILAALKQHLNNKICKKKFSSHINALSMGLMHGYRNNNSLINIINEVKLASMEMVNIVLSAKQNGEQAKIEFIGRFTTSLNQNVKYDDIMKCKLSTHLAIWNQLKQEWNPYLKEGECESFGNVLSKYDSMKLNL